MRPDRLLLLLFLPLGVLFSCHPERPYAEDPSARLAFSLDTVYFDTVFTQIGTATKSFRIKNPNRRYIRIDELRLAGGEESVFRVNVDGRPGSRFTDLEIAPGDSMYVFVEATLRPSSSEDVLRIQDSIVCLTNGNVQDVDLVAWGQDVHLLRDTLLVESATWTGDKPYLILGDVVVDADAILRLEEGTRVHLHRDARILVAGSLQVEGSLERPVEFLGDRLEDFYEDIPGQWGFIYLSQDSHDNVLHHARILNGTLGILISSAPESGLRPDLEIRNTVINHMSSHGIYALNARIDGRNLVVGECGGSSLALIYGGDYRFLHCTFANYWRSWFANRSLPAVSLTDYFVTYTEAGDPQLYVDGEFVRADFLNSVIYGNSSMELVLDSYNQRVLNCRFDHCLTRILTDSLDYASDARFSQIINLESPRLDSVPWTFRPTEESPLIDAGLASYGVDMPFDLEGVNRMLDAAPDIGAYEYQK
ncbi:MAG: choice-of-anchor Q domain-containing protein [Bacteroidales bacterium]